MDATTIKASRVAIAFAALVLADCGGGGGGRSPPETYTVGGTVSGLAGAGLVLRDNGADDLSVSANGSFTFATRVATDRAYGVSVQAQPTNPSQNCFVTNASGSGTVANANVTSITVKCADVGRFLYVANGNSDSVSGFTIDASTGALTPVAGSPYSTGRYPVSVAVTPDGRFAYVASSDGISAYTIDRATGALTTNSSGTIPLPLNGGSTIAVDPTGTFAYLLSPNSIWVYRIDANSGALAAVPGGPFAAGIQPVSIAFDRNLRFAYVADYGYAYAPPACCGDVRAYRIDAKTGALTQTGTFSPCPAPEPSGGYFGGPNVYSVVVDLSGQFAVAFVSGDTNSAAWKFPIDSATGAITSATCPDAGVYNPPQLSPGGKVDLSLWLMRNATEGSYNGALSGLAAFDPSGRFGFAFCPAGLCAFSIDANTGAVAPAAASALQPDLLRRFMALHPSGKFAYTLDDPDGISVYSVDATTGALAAVPATPIAVGTKPEALAISADGRFAYTANWGSKDISGYAIDAGSGSLAPLPGSPFAVDLNNPASVTADPLGRFVYASDSNSGVIESFPVNATTGVLTTGAGPTPSGVSLGPVAVEPLGRFAYASGENMAANEKGLYGYSIAATTGALVPLAGDPFPLGGASEAGAVIADPLGRFVLATNYISEVVDGVSVSAIDPVTGALALVPGSPFAIGPDAASVAVDPSGRFVYVLNCASCTLSSIAAFSIDSMTGALTPIAGGSVNAGTNAINITVDPRGAFVYVACPDGVWAFAIDGATGALSPVAGNQFAPGVAYPIAFAVTN